MSMVIQPAHKCFQFLFVDQCCQLFSSDRISWTGNDFYRYTTKPNRHLGQFVREIRWKLDRILVRIATRGHIHKTFYYKFVRPEYLEILMTKSGFWGWCHQRFMLSTLKIINYLFVMCNVFSNSSKSYENFTFDLKFFVNMAPCWQNKYQKFNQ
jgi:hypothetical protein